MGPEDPDLEDDQEQDDAPETEEDDGQGEPDGQDEADGAAEEHAAKSDAPEVPTEGQGRQVGRGERAVLRAKEEARKAQEEARRAADEARKARQELEALRAQAAQPDPRIEQERLAAMTPEERFQYYRQQDQQRFESQLRQVQFHQQETADRAAYAALKAESTSRGRIAARLEQKVEDYLRQARASGQNYPREVLLKFLAGEELLANATKAAAKQAAQGRERIERQRVRPSGGGSDVPASRRGGGSLEDRLADVVF